MQHGVPQLCVTVWNLPGSLLRNAVSCCKVSGRLAVELHIPEAGYCKNKMEHTSSKYIVWAQGKRSWILNLTVHTSLATSGIWRVKRVLGRMIHFFSTIIINLGRIRRLTHLGNEKHKQNSGHQITTDKTCWETLVYIKGTINYPCNW